MFKIRLVEDHKFLNGRLKLTQKDFSTIQTVNTRLNHTSARNMEKMEQKLKLDIYQSNLKDSIIKVLTVRQYFLVRAFSDLIVSAKLYFIPS